jgi:glycosyltransferase involved in cell wall biosynthesis
VTYYQRRLQSDYSIRRLFADVRRSLPDDIDATVAVSSFESRGLFRRIYNILEAAFRQGDVNHVTGDVHFLTYLLRGDRTVLTILDLGTLHRLRGWRRALFLYLWFWLPIRRVAVVSVISEFTKQDLLRHVKVDDQKIRIVHCPVSPNFTPITREFSNSRPIVLLIGTRPNIGKNVERVVQALQGIPCRLRVIGDLDDNQLRTLRQCEVAYSSASNISDDQVIEEYRQCDMLVFASIYEGFGLPIVEAQATGRPVVTSTTCSMPEVAGSAACLVNPFDVASIREGIVKVIDDQAYRDELVRLGFENVKRFRADYISAQYGKIYKDLVVP